MPGPEFLAAVTAEEPSRERDGPTQGRPGCAWQVYCSRPRCESALLLARHSAQTDRPNGKLTSPAAALTKRIGVAAKVLPRSRLA